MYVGCQALWQDRLWLIHNPCHLAFAAISPVYNSVSTFTEGTASAPQTSP